MLRGNPHESGIGSGDINAHVTRIPLSVDSASHRVTIPDTELLFSAKFTRAGSDLVLTGEDGHKIVLSGYFDQPRHADLVAPGGAILTADVVAKLTISQTPGQYAQAGAPAGAVAIGKVERLGGSATVQHANGTVEELHVGDNVYQGDVVETQGGSQLGMSFMDGTAFNMGASARMVLSELVYDSNSNSNSGVFSLVKGTITFVAGKVAKTGDMRVETPVATMGIRGTTVNTNITTDIGGNTVSVTYSLMTDPDGHVGSFNILDRVTGAIIGTITTTDTTFVVTPTANLGVLATQLNKTPEQIAQELQAAGAVFPIFLANPENFNNQNVNPQNGHHGSGTPPGGSQQGLGGQGNSGTGTGGNITHTDGGQNGTGTGGNFHVDLPHVNQAPSVFADVPTHLVEAVSLGDQGAATALSHITKVDLDGTVSYNTFAMANDGWINFGNGIYSKLGTYGAASLNASGTSVANMVADGWTDLGNGFLEKTVSFGAAGNATIRISTGIDTVTYALDNNKADPLRQIDHPTETFVIPVIDDSSATASTTVVFTVDGRNDPPSIVTGSTTATGGVTEDSSPTTLTTNGTITFKDAELTDTHTLTGTPTVPSSVTVTDGNGHSEPLPGFNPASDYLGTLTLSVVENPNDASNIGTVGWTFSVNDNDPRVQALAVGQVITQVYTVTIDDGQGGSVQQQITVTITGSNDDPNNSAPVIVAGSVVTGAFDELSSPAPSTGLTTTDSVGGTIKFIDIDLIDTHTATKTFVSAEWTKAGGATASIADPGGLTLSAVHENPADTDNQGSVDWTYSAVDANLDFLAAGETLVVTYDVKIQDNTGSFVVQPVTVTITGTNDVPKISVVGGDTSSAAVTETNAPLSTSGTLSVSDADVTNTVAASVYDLSLGGTGLGGKPASLTLADLKAMLSVDNGNVIDNTHTTGTIHWSFASAPQAFDFLRDSQTLILTYTVRATDSDLSHAIADQVVTVTITGTNDLPILSAITPPSAVIEDADASAQDIAAIHGSLSVSDLDVGDTLTASIVGSPAVKLDGGAFTLPAGASALIAGALTFDATATSDGGGKTIGWTYDPAAANLDFLRDGQSLTLTYTVKVNDGLADSGTQDIVVTITGTNDLPVLSAITPPAAVIEAADASAQDIAAIHGSLSVSDLDVGDTLTASIVGSPVVKLDGSAFTLPAGAAALIAGALTFDATATSDGGGKTIGWTYDPAAVNLDFLGEGQSLTLTYAVKVNDGLGDSGTQDIVVTITGTNDVPVVDLTPDLTRVSVPAPPSAGTDTAAVNAIAPAMSLDGRYVIFSGSEQQLTDAPPGEVRGDVYLYDRLTGTTTTLTDDAHISSRPASAPGFPSETYVGFAINANGSYAVFQGQREVADPSPVGHHTESEIYVYDRVHDTTALLPHPNSPSPYTINDLPRISSGGLVAFSHTDFQINAPSVSHIQVSDLSGRFVTDITAASIGLNSTLSLETVDISGNGRYLTFWALQHDINAQPIGDATLYYYDRVTHSSQAIATTTATDDPWWASMSDDGSTVVFQSDKPLSGAQDTNNALDVFIWLRDANNGAGQIVGITDPTQQLGLGSARASISADGKYITFASQATNLVPGDTNGHSDTFVYDIQAQTFTRLSVAADGTQGNDVSSAVSDISFGGPFAAFGSLASTLTPGDTNNASDIFVVDRSGGTTGVVIEDNTTPGMANAPANSISTHGAFKFSDVDLSDTHGVTYTLLSATGAPAGFTIPSGGLGTFTPTVVENPNDNDPHAQVAWTFSVANADVQALGGGQQIQQTYQVTIDDHNGGVITQDVTIVVAGINDAPVLTAASPTLTGITEDDTSNSGQTVASIVGSSITDADVGALQGIAITGETHSNGKWQYSLDNGSHWSDFGTYSTTNSLTLAATDYVRFLPNAKNGGIDTFTYVAWDQTTSAQHGAMPNSSFNGGFTAFSTASDTATLTVASVNDAPVLTPADPQLTGITEDDTSNGGQTVSSFAGASITDVDTGFQKGIAITGASSANGTWEYSINNGSTWSSFGTYSASFALLLNGGDLVRFHPDAQNGGTDTFTYVAWDRTSGSHGSTADTTTAGDTTAFSVASDTAHLTVTDVNDAPVATGDSFTTDEDSVLVVTGSILSNDIDVDNGSSLTVAEVNGVAADVGQPITLASGAHLTLNADGTYQYDPTGVAAFDALAQGEHTTDSFTYTAQDEHNALSNTVTVEITVNGVNDAPVATGDSFTTDEDSVLVVTGSILSNDIDVDNGSSLTVAEINGVAADVGQLITLASGAHLTVNTDGTYQYDPTGVAAFDALAQGEHTTDSFTYTAQDEHGALSNTVTVEITVNGVNDTPLANNDGFTTDEDSVLVVTGSILSNDIDVDNGSSLTVAEVVGQAANVGTQITLASGAHLTVNADGTFQYDPTGVAAFDALGQGEAAFDNFWYAAQDEHGALSNTAAVTLIINGVNDAPVANNDSASTDEDSVLVVTGSILSNDIDVDHGSSLTVAEVNGVAADVGQLITLASGAHLTLNTDGTYQYDPTGVAAFDALAQGEHTTDSFTYAAQDEHGALSNTVTVEITVNGVNDAPVFGTADLTGAVSEYNNTFVTNGDMQAPTLAPNTFPVGSFDGWTATGGAGLWRPNSHFTSSQLPDYDNGAQVAYINGGSLSQDIGVVLPSTVYTVGVDLYGRGDASGGTPYQLELLIGGQHVGLVQTGTGPGPGLAQHLDLTFDTTGLNLDSFTIGQTAVTLEVSESAANAQLVLDNVTVTTSKLYDTGTIAFTDADTADAHLVSSSAVGTTFGTLSTALTTDTTGTGTGGLVTWTYQLTDPSAVASLTAGQTAVDSFLVTIDDQHGGTVTRQVDVTLTGTNHQPVATDDSFIVNDSGAGTLPSLGAILKSNDDTDYNDSFSITSVSAVSGGGSDSLNGGDPTFTPPSTAATSTFTYTTTNASGTVTTATVTVDVQAGTTLTGTAGNDTLISSSGSQTMTGGAGADTFVFAGTIGNDIVTDFTVGTDKINIDHTIFADFAALQDAISNPTGDAVITHGADTITLQNVVKSALIASDFHFV